MRRLLLGVRTAHLSCACHDIMIVSATVTVSNRLSLCQAASPVSHNSAWKQYIFRPVLLMFAHMLHPMLNTDLFVFNLLIHPNHIVTVTLLSYFIEAPLLMVDL